MLAAILSLAAMGPIASEDAYKHEGETATVRVKVVQARPDTLHPDASVVLLGKGLTVLIGHSVAGGPDSEPGKLEALAKHWKGKTIDVTGKISRRQTRKKEEIRIFVREPEQVVEVKDNVR